MGRDSSIRRLRIAISQHGADAGVALLFVAALIAGAPSALAGFGEFAEAITPNIAANASGVTEPVVRRPLLPSGFVESSASTAPRVLSPIANQPAPTPQGATALATTTPVVAICIDDLGPDAAGTALAIRLPKDVTLSFLPFAPSTFSLAQDAEQDGHEVLAHVPMEAVGPTDPGPMTLKVGAQDNVEKLTWALARVPGLSGINNHEGSKFSTDIASLIPVVQQLSARRLFFFDSRTIAGSQVVPVAHKFGVASAGRDVFLDNVLTDAAIAAQLDLLAAKARKTGVSIAIGHPHQVTLRVLAAWLSGEHGVRLVPVSEAIRLRTQHSELMAAE